MVSVNNAEVDRPVVYSVYGSFISLFDQDETCLCFVCLLVEVVHLAGWFTGCINFFQKIVFDVGRCWMFLIMASDMLKLFQSYWYFENDGYAVYLSSCYIGSSKLDGSYQC